MTFTIVAADPGTGLVGLCQGTSAMGVASRCTHVRSGVAAVASQSHSDWRIGRRALDLVGSWLEPDATLRALATTDAHFGHRQVGVVTPDGRVGAHTGPSCGPYAAHRTGDAYAVLGNLLVGQGVLDAMAERYEASRASGAEGVTAEIFADRLLGAVEAGLAAGGEGVTHLSSTVVVAGPASPRPLLDLRVDVAPVGGDAIPELRRIVEQFAPFVDYYADYWLDHPDVTPEQWREQGSPTTR
ncbi:DUF1028 domain-containing protein [Microlunatus flavus]|uniref:Uncharacterized conserved protein, Ntn-hydrolase superfamily n=1 Tax=Microlunatus flavus TaxID=1036181 RepID=A0A1H9G3P0_9ACTN|nr:DUF1028 domain-containing protein [Microlunatus flavus]SEQ44737.1 Uncharacterized conserved protein, Ntn-hydrolase superfamily [Microlunatus flavus]